MQYAMHVCVLTIIACVDIKIIKTHQLNAQYLTQTRGLNISNLLYCMRDMAIATDAIGDFYQHR